MIATLDMFNGDNHQQFYQLQLLACVSETSNFYSTYNQNNNNIFYFTRYRYS